MKSAIASSLLKYKITEFGGTDEYVTMGNVAALNFERTNSFSLSVWVNYTLGHVGVIMGKAATDSVVARGYDLHTLDGGELGVNLNSNFGGNNYIGFGTTAAFNDGTWHHVCFTYNGNSNVSGCKLYVDTVNQSLSTFQNTLSATIQSTAEFRIACRTVSSQLLPYTGQAMDAAVYNKELSSGEVSTIYNNNCPPDLTSIGPTANLIGYWLLGTHVGDTNLASDASSFPNCPDASTNNNTGTMTNMESSDIITKK